MGRPPEKIQTFSKSYRLAISKYNAKNILLISVLKTIKEYIKELAHNLPNFYPEDEAFSVAEYYVKEVLGISSKQMHIRKNEIISESELYTLEENVSRLIAGEPVQYVTGKAYFYDLEFYVDKRVLIPRQETEILIKTILHNFKDNSEIKILDIGTGSGCIAVSLKANLPHADVHTIDVSAGALDVCSINAASNSAKLCYHHFDILSNKEFNPEIKFDLIVSNPPYVRESEKEFMLKNVVDFEPDLALYVKDEDPLLFYRAIIEFAVHHLKANGELYLEINEMFGNEVANLCTQKGLSNVDIIKDVCEKDRFVLSKM